MYYLKYIRDSLHLYKGRYKNLVNYGAYSSWNDTQDLMPKLFCASTLNQKILIASYHL